ncbi:biotin-dependent carboxyltransferase family protein [Oleispirillum naphthae]|uniref:5-oxoprolinase subunit C family protein n=1 Tax=Oleispirillum naphthae TaxID=2838853 RepID=UPI00308236BA
MAQIRIHRPGPLTTVQDRGRFGFQALGIPTAGAADGFSFRLGNRLLGNPDGAAALEYWVIGPEVEALDAPVRLALAAGGGTLTRANGDRLALPAWRTVTLFPGDRIALGPTVGGAAGYACFAGGVDVAPVMGSRSTYVRAKLGGFAGRALKTGDVLPVGVEVEAAGGERALSESPVDGEGPFRVVLGPQDDRFDDAGVERFFTEIYKISPQSDRMGKRLVGPPLTFAPGRGGADIVSDGMVAGAIQVPGSGEPIIMLADRATVGGYAKIGAVISADLPRFARLKPMMEVTFARVSVAEAEAAAQAFEMRLAELAAAAVALD